MSSTRKIRVLIADDESHIRILVRQLFIAMGADVVAEASDGAEAVEAYEKEKPDITLLDVSMPRMDGVRALKRIIGMAPGAFVVMLTSLTAMEVVNECMKSGASGYIRKDATTAQIKKTILDSWKDYLAAAKKQEEERG
ncbi:MAG: response regulator transcription factor [Nitrospinota bacterium]|nr:response regulator transcription factor [Nitrospinota bacterium]MDH5678161.1 response regulator transcription factor [Nitrospinota bacterium]MDH5756536.1 response regulator transcription factor [Nitrospinota bacterium]